MKYGMNLLLWSGELHESLLPILASLRKMGFDGVEIPLFNLDLDYNAWGKRLDDLGLARTAVTVRNAGDNPISPDSTIRTAGVEANKRTLDCCLALGATHLVGPLHSAIGEFSGCGATEDEWKWGIESMRTVAEHAGTLGIELGVEPLNRFELYFLNSMEDGGRFVAEVNHPNCHLLFDTFHSNIEEKSVVEAIRGGRDVIGHVHICENDRSTPGHGLVHWDEVFDTLHDIQYNGWLTIEAFGLALPELAAATKIWRRMYESEDKLAREGLAFMKSEIDKRLP